MSRREILTKKTMNFLKNAYACGICQHSFLDSKSLLSHVQTKHVEDKNSKHGHIDQKDNTLTLHISERKYVCRVS